MRLWKHTATTLLLMISTGSAYGGQQSDGYGIAAETTNSPVAQRNNPRRRYRPKLGSGMLTGIVHRVEPADGKAEFLWVKSRGVMHQFDIAHPRPAVLVGGDISKEGSRVRVTYRNLALSEMDYFYTGHAVRVVILKNYCLSYEPASVTLTGRVSLKVFPGRPNYESIKEGDEPEPAWLLRLAKPICVTLDGKDEFNVAVDDVSVIHLVLQGKQFSQLRRLKRKGAVTLTGKLFHAFTGHHHADVLMRVSSMKEQLR